MSVNTNPTCPTGCTNTPPEVLFDYCAPVTGFGEINYIYVASAADNTYLDDWSSLSEWTDRLSQDGVVGTEIRKLTVIGNKPAPEYQEIEMSLNRKRVSTKMHTVAFRIDEITDENYAALRQFECGGTFRIWYEDYAGYLYGGNAGIEATIKADHVIPESSQELQYFEGTVTWEAKYHPERIESPMA